MAGHADRLEEPAEVVHPISDVDEGVAVRARAPHPVLHVIEREAAGPRVDVSDRIEAAVQELTHVGPVDVDLEVDQVRVGLRDGDVPQPNAVDDRELTGVVVLVELDAARLGRRAEGVEELRGPVVGVGRAALLGREERVGRVRGADVREAQDLGVVEHLREAVAELGEADVATDPAQPVSIEELADLRHRDRRKRGALRVAGELHLGIALPGQLAEYRIEADVRDLVAYGEELDADAVARKQPVVLAIGQGRPGEQAAARRERCGGCRAGGALEKAAPAETWLVRHGPSSSGMLRDVDCAAPRAGRLTRRLRRRPARTSSG